MQIKKLNLEEMVSKISSLPDLRAWKTKGIRSERLGVKVAPEDFYVVFDDGGKKEYFTAVEMRMFERIFLVPKGWRLPTADEWHALVEEFGTEDGESDHRILMDNLGLRYGGYVEEDVTDDYNTNPSDPDHIHNLGSAGYYLARNPDGHCADCADEVARYFYYLKYRDVKLGFVTWVLELL